MSQVVGQATSGTVRSLNNQALTSKQQRVLPLKQIKEIINDIFNSKFKYDAKCRETQMPIETMEQYLYTYLTKKYGLKVGVLHSKQASS